MKILIAPRLVYRALRLKRIASFIVSFGVVVLGLSAAGQNPLFVPPTLEGPVFDLSMETGATQFYGGNATATAGYNGSILGPTLIMNSGDFVTLNVVNNLEDTTTTHWHGMHVAAVATYIEPCAQAPAITGATTAIEDSDLSDGFAITAFKHGFGVELTMSVGEPVEVANQVFFEDGVRTRVVTYKVTATGTSTFYFFSAKRSTMTSSSLFTNSASCDACD